MLGERAPDEAVIATIDYYLDRLFRPSSATSNGASVDVSSAPPR